MHMDLAQLHCLAQVLFVKVADNEGLQQLEAVARVVAHHYSQAGLTAADEKAFQAHLTVAKTSAAAKRGKKRRRLKGIPKVRCLCFGCCMHFASC